MSRPIPAGDDAAVVARTNRSDEPILARTIAFQRLSLLIVLYAALGALFQSTLAGWADALGLLLVGNSVALSEQIRAIPNGGTAMSGILLAAVYVTRPGAPVFRTVASYTDWTYALSSAFVLGMLASSVVG